MLISQIELTCRYHLGQKVVFVDQSPKILGNTRAMCNVCIRNTSQKNIICKLNLLGLDDFQMKAKMYAIEQEMKIKQKYEDEKKKLENIIKSFITLKEESLKEYNKLIQIVTDTLESLKKITQDDLQHLEDFGRNTNYTRFLEIAEILIDQTKQDQNSNQITKKLEELTIQITVSSQMIKEKIIKNLDLLINAGTTQNESLEQSDNSNELLKTLPKNQKIKITPNSQRQSLQNQVPQVNQDISSPRIHLSLLTSNQSLRQQYPAIQKENTILKIPLDNESGQLPKMKQVFDCPWQCQILVSNKEQSLIVGGVSSMIGIWEQRANQIVKSQTCSGHTDLITGIALFSSQTLIVSGGLDKQLIVWKKNVYIGWKAQTFDQKCSEITKIELTNNESQIIVSYKNLTLQCYHMDTQLKLNLFQTLTYSHHICSFSVDQLTKYLAVGGEEYLLNIYKLTQQDWSYLYKVEFEGSVQQLRFTTDNELICLFNRPSNFVVYYILEDIYVKHQTVSLNWNLTYETFPIFKIQQIYCCKLGQTIYLFKKQNKQNYKIFQEIQGDYEAACSDAEGNNIILKHRFEKQLQVYCLD